MKKIYFGAVLTAVAVSAGSIVAVAAESTVTVKVDSENLTYSYDAANGEYSESVADLLAAEDENTSDKIVKEFSITSNTEEKGGIEFSLRITADENAVDDGFSVADYYFIKISDIDGNVIYDSTVDEEEKNDSGIDIALGVFNTQFTEDTKSYIIEYGINPESGYTADMAEKYGIDVSIVSDVYSASAEDTNQDVSGITPTLKPEFELNTSDTTTAAVQEATPAPTAAPSAQPSESADEQKVKKIVCGEDIEPGRYTVTGNANVKIETKNGELISETVVTDGSDASIKGVKQFMTTLEDGDIITITPLSENIKAAVNFEKSTGSDSKNATASSSSSNKNSKTQSTAKPSSSSKTNPKTGDVGTTTTVLGSVMGISAAAAGSLEVLKRKKKSGK